MASEKLARQLAVLVTLVFVVLGVLGVLEGRRAEGSVTTTEARDAVQQLIDRALAHDREGVCHFAESGDERDACLEQLSGPLPTYWPVALPTLASSKATAGGQLVTMAWRNPDGSDQRAEIMVSRRGRSGIVMSGPVFWVVDSG